MDFAVVRVAGKQHVVTAGSQIEITGDPQKVEVLLLAQGDKVAVGTPLVDGAVVKTEVVSTGKGEKIRVAKFKSKVRYRKVMGFRPLITTLKVLSIGDEKVSTNSRKQPRAGKSRAKKSSKV